MLCNGLGTKIIHRLHSTPGRILPSVVTSNGAGQGQGWSTYCAHRWRDWDGALTWISLSEQTKSEFNMPASKAYLRCLVAWPLHLYRMTRRPLFYSVWCTPNENRYFGIPRKQSTFKSHQASTRFRLLPSK